MNPAALNVWMPSPRYGRYEHGAVPLMLATSTKLLPHGFCRPLSWDTAVAIRMTMQKQLFSYRQVARLAANEPRPEAALRESPGFGLLRRRDLERRQGRRRGSCQHTQEFFDHGQKN